MRIYLWATCTVIFKMTLQRWNKK